MRSLLPASLLSTLAVAVLAVGSVAQGRADPVPVRDTSPPRVTAAAGTMVAAGPFLYVLRNDVLWQFDARTLAIVRTFPFPADGAAAAPGAAPAAPIDAGARAAAVTRALDWLARHQDEDGRWDSDGFHEHDAEPMADPGPGKAVHDVGVTALVMLAMLGDGSTLRTGPWRGPLKKAAKWLTENQMENGVFGTNASHDFVYDHAMATFAMCEAYGRSNYDLLRPAAQRGVDYLESHRNPHMVWRYQPRDGDNDTSVTTWAIAAYAAAKRHGLQVNDDAFRAAERWSDQVTTPDGRAGYTQRGEPSSRLPGDHAARFPPQHGEAMTAAALFGRLAIGQVPAQAPIIGKSADRLLERLPEWTDGKIDAVYWFFGAHALQRLGGTHWRQWQHALDSVVQHQRSDGSAAGSWDPVGVWDAEGGRVFVTALYTLALQALDGDAPPTGR